MQLVKIATSSALPVPLADIMLDLRADSPDFAPIIERLALGAADYLERKTGFVLLQGTYHAIFSEWPDRFFILRAPLREVIAVQYLEAVDTWADVDMAEFQVSRRAKEFLIIPPKSFTSPTLFSCEDSLRVEFTAGFDNDESGDTSGVMFPITPILRSLLIALVADAFKNTEIGDLNMGLVEARWHPLLASCRQFW